MSMKMIFVGTFLINTLIGSTCTMPMAMAAEMPAHHDMDSMEEMMTPLAQMSHADCDHCPHHTEKKEPAPSSSSCAGHCLSQATNTNPSNVTFSSSQLIAALPASFPLVWNAVTNTNQRQLINASPPPIPDTTVVLRL